MHQTNNVSAPLLLVMSIAACDNRADDRLSLDELRQNGTVLHEGQQISLGGRVVTVPPSGQGAHLCLLHADGDAEEIDINTAADGTAVMTSSLDTPESPATCPGGNPIDACVNNANSLRPYRWAHALAWHFNPAGLPGGMTIVDAENTMRNASTHIVNGFNDCSLPDAISATHSYLGRTTIPASQTDGVSVAGFSALGANGPLAIEFTAYNQNFEATESDIEVNNQYAWYLGAVPPGCALKYSMLGVVTHERGHNYGLGHVCGTRNRNLTMHTLTFACQNGTNTLGLGDVRGLEAKY